MVRDQIELLRLDADASVLNSLATLPGSEALDAVGITAVGGRLQFGGSTAPFRNTLIVIGADNIYVATGDRFEILVFPPEGGSPDVISKDYELRPFTLDDFIEFLAGTRYADRIPDRSIRDWPKDQTRPAIVSLQVDDDGNLWAEEGREDPYAASIWSVFDPSGAYITKVTMPLRFRPFDIRTESVLGVWRDDLDVEYVQLRAIVKTNNQ